MSLRARVSVGALIATGIIVVMALQVLASVATLRSGSDLILEHLQPAGAEVDQLQHEVAAMTRQAVAAARSGSAQEQEDLAQSKAAVEESLTQIHVLVGGDPTLAGELAALEAARQAWQVEVGDPVLTAVGAGDPSAAREVLDSPAARAAQEQLETAIKAFTDALDAATTDALAASADDARTFLVSMLTTLAVALALPLLAYLALRKQVLGPIGSLRDQLRQSTVPGGHDRVIVPSGPPEIHDVAADAEALRRALVREIDLAQAAVEALEQEGPVVTAIRRELSVRSDGIPPGVQIEGVLRPAEGMLAGDFWDRFTLPDGRACAVLCDVSGHGPRAGVVAMRMKTALTLGLANGQTPEEILHRACDTFAEEPDRFATVLVIIADPVDGTLSWVNAGHPAPRLIRGKGGVERLGTTGPMVCWLVGTWRRGTTSLAPGDVCVAFSDGILESRDSAGQQLGDDELDAWLESAAAGGTAPAEVVARVVGGVRERAVAIGSDDVTLFALRLTPD